MKDIFREIKSLPRTQMHIQAGQLAPTLQEGKRSMARKCKYILLSMQLTRLVIHSSISRQYNNDLAFFQFQVIPRKEFMFKSNKRATILCI